MVKTQSLHACSEMCLVAEVDNIIKWLFLGSSASSLLLQIGGAEKFRSEEPTETQSRRKAQGWSSLVSLYCFMPEFILF